MHRRLADQNEQIGCKQKKNKQEQLVSRGNILNKVIAALLLVQTGLLLLLLSKIAVSQNSADEVQVHAETAARPPAVSAYARNDVPVLSETRLREIIREELAAQGQASILAVHEDPPSPIPELAYTRDDALEFDKLSEQLSYFESVGIISEREMMQFQADLGKLHPADRREVLSRLFQAMNAGKIDARL